MKKRLIALTHSDNSFCLEKKLFKKFKDKIFGYVEKTQYFYN